jgi:hypothetical protein
MKEYRTKEGPFPLRLHYETKDIDDICLDALREAKLLPSEPSPIKIDLFLEKYFKVVVDYRDLGPGIMGSTIFNSKGAVTGIIIAPWIEEEGTDVAERRVRSTLAHEPSQTDLYHWCYQNRAWVDELTALLDLKLYWEHQDRTVQAVPQSAAFLLRLKLDATLVLLTLWYEFDTAIRDRGETPPVRLTAQQLNDALAAKFEPLRKFQPSPTRLREILSLAQRKNLLRFIPNEAAENSVIEIYPTLKRVIPFQNIEEWNKHADRYLAAAKDTDATAPLLADDEEGDKDE